ncbi:MAG: hypothetical protein QM757_26010 [Paludibaculum sp.]
MKRTTSIRMEGGVRTRGRRVLTRWCARAIASAVAVQIRPIRDLAAVVLVAAAGAAACSAWFGAEAQVRELFVLLHKDELMRESPGRASAVWRQVPVGRQREYAPRVATLLERHMRGILDLYWEGDAVESNWSAMELLIDWLAELEPASSWVKWKGLAHAQILVWRGEELSDVARPALELAAAELPRPALAHAALAAVQSTVGDESGARRSFEEALRSEPQWAYCHELYARHLIGTREFGTALQHAEAASRLRPESAAPHFLAGEVQRMWSRGRQSAACQEYRRAMELAKNAKNQRFDVEYVAGFLRSRCGRY